MSLYANSLGVMLIADPKVVLGENPNSNFDGIEYELFTKLHCIKTLLTGVKFGVIFDNML